MDTFCTMHVDAGVLLPALGSRSGGPRERPPETEGSGCVLSSRDNSEQEYLLALSAHYEVEHYEDSYDVMGECRGSDYH